MARRTLDRHSKFKRLWRELKISRPLARGLLELWWDSAHDASDPTFNSAAEVEACAEWEGEPGALVKKLLELKLADPAPKGTIKIHDYWDHCPEYVHKRLLYRQQKMAENGGKSPRKSAKPQPDPRSDPKPEPVPSRSPNRIDAGVPAIPESAISERPIESKRGGSPENAGNVAQAILNSIPTRPNRPIDPASRKPKIRDPYTFDLDDVVRFIASFELSGNQEKYQTMWRTRLTPISKVKDGMHWLRELCDHVQQSIHGNEAKGIGALQNIPAYCNKKTSQFLLKRKSA